MPTVNPVASAPPKPAVSVDEARATALAAARREDSAGVIAALETLAWGERGPLARTVFASLAEEDLATASRVVVTLPRSAAQTQGTEAVARAYVARDPAAAVAWALQVPVSDVGSYARESVADRLSAREGPRALDRLHALPDSAGRNQMLGFAAASWARRDAPAALAWLRDLPAGEGKARAATSIGFALAQVQPERATEVIEWVPPGRDRWALIGTLSQTWVARDPEAAWKWSQQLAAGAARESAMAGIETGLGAARSSRGDLITPGLASLGGGGGGLVTALNPAAASSLPPGIERDAALRREFESQLQISPARAANWLSTQLPGEKRPEMVDEVARRWLQLDPSSAQLWIDQNIFLPEQKERLLREAGR